MVDICEHCGKEIEYPNYIVSCFEGIWETFVECAVCELEYKKDQLELVKDEFPNEDYSKLEQEIIELKQKLKL